MCIKRPRDRTKNCGMDCILAIIRALRTGSCFPLEGASAHPYSPSSKGRKKRRQRRASSSLDSKREEELRKFPGRMYLNGSSEVASLFTRQGKKGANQDAMIVWENFASRADTVFCGVFDGHGPNGHMVARKVRDLLPLKLSANWEVNNVDQDEFLMRNSFSITESMNSEDSCLLHAEEERRTSVDIVDKGKSLDMLTSLKESFFKAFRTMDKELRVQPSIDCFCSGTTAVTLVKQGHDIVIGNIGDSRAVLGTRDQNDTITAVQLTVDLKPNLPEEAERIRKCRGRIFALQDEPDVARVWLPHNNSPGLAMARAFGDFCLKDFGLTSIPEISHRHLTERDEFIVLATDGLWDVFSNEEVVDIVAHSPSRSLAAKTLVESAVRAWRYKYPTSKVDDCAVVCLFLDTNTSSCSSNMFDGQPSMKEANVGSDVKTGATCSSTDTVLDVSLEDSNENDNNSEGGNQDWLALEGVSRVNTLLALPRFGPGRDGKESKNPHK